MASTSNSIGSEFREPSQPSLTHFQQYLEGRYEEITQEIEAISRSIRERSIQVSRMKEGTKTKVAKPVGGPEVDHSPLQADDSRTESGSARLPSEVDFPRWEVGKIPKVSTVGRGNWAGRLEKTYPQSPTEEKREIGLEGAASEPVDQFITIPDSVEGMRRYKIILEPPERTSTRRESILEAIAAVQSSDNNDGVAIKKNGKPSETKPSSQNGESTSDKGLTNRVPGTSDEKNQGSQTNLIAGLDAKSSPDAKVDKTQKEPVEKISATTRTKKSKERPVIKPDRYDGKTSWASYLKHFELCSEVNDWSDGDRFQFLAVLLSGPAQQVLNTMPKDATGDYKQLVKALQARFDPKEKQELYRAQLRNRRQAPLENLVEMAEDIRLLVDKVYVDLPAESRDRMGRDHFLDALAEGDIRIRVIQMRTSTLDGAVAAAVELETLRKAEKERQSRDLKKANVRQISTTAEGNLPEQAGLQMQLSKLTEQLGELQKQVSRQRPGRNRGPNDRGPQCYQCKEYGHIKPNCPLRKKEDSRPAPSAVSQPQRNDKPENC